MLRLLSCTKSTRYVLSRFLLSSLCKFVSESGGLCTYLFKPSSTAIRQAYLKEDDSLIPEVIFLSKETYVSYIGPCSLEAEMTLKDVEVIRVDDLQYYLVPSNKLDT